MTATIRLGTIVFATWMIVFGALVFVASLRQPDAELMPLAALMGVVLGILLLFALWAFPSSRGRSRAYGDDDD